MFKFSWRLTSFSAAKPSHHLPVSSRECFCCVCKYKLQNLLNPEGTFSMFFKLFKKIRSRWCSDDEEKLFRNRRVKFSNYSSLSPQQQRCKHENVRISTPIFNDLFSVFPSTRRPAMVRCVLHKLALCALDACESSSLSSLVKKTLVNFNFSSSCRSRLPNISSNKK